MFIESFPESQQQIDLDVDATDEPLHGRQDGRFFHGCGDEQRRAAPLSNEKTTEIAGPARPAAAERRRRPGCRPKPPKDAAAGRQLKQHRTLTACGRTLKCNRDFLSIRRMRSGIVACPAYEV